MESGSFTYLTGQVLEKELQKSSELIDEFIYSCSHGLRSPVKSMAGLVSLLKQCSGEAETDRQLYLLLLNQSIAKAQSIRQQFEEFSSVIRTPRAEVPISLNVFFKKLVSKFKGELKASAVAVECHIDQRELLVADTDGLALIVSQLLSNAITFSQHETTAGRISFFVTCSAYSCSIQVHDNGIGIAESIQNKIFNLFYRGSEHSRGAGIGLYIAREVAVKMGGSLALQSSGACGSVFSLWVPNRASRAFLSGNP